MTAPEGLPMPHALAEAAEPPEPGPAPGGGPASVTGRTGAVGDVILVDGEPARHDGRPVRVRPTLEPTAGPMAPDRFARLLAATRALRDAWGVDTRTLEQIDAELYDADGLPR